MPNVYTIPKKAAGTGSVCDIASENMDRRIVFRKGCEYAVVRASRYGGKGYTTHKDQHTAFIAAYHCNKYSYKIIDVNGFSYHVAR